MAHRVNRIPLAELELARASNPEEAPGPAAEWIVLPAPPLVDRARPLGAERPSG